MNKRNDRKAIVSKITNGNDTAQNQSKGMPIHKLVNMAPSTISPIVIAHEGSFAPIDWYINGLKSSVGNNNNVRKTFENYIYNKTVFDYNANFTNPFESEDFQKQLASEKRNFVSNIYNYQVRPLPEFFTSFTMMKLENYNMQTNILTVKMCRDFGSNDSFQNGMRCGSEGLHIPEESVENLLQALSSNSKLVESKKLRFVKFATRITGDNNDAPLYLLSHGFPSEIKFRVSKDTANLLYQLAKTTPVKSQYKNDFTGKLLSAKVLYGKPILNGFAASNRINKGVFSTQTGGAAVGYNTPAKAICIFDGVGTTAVHCQDL